MNRKWAALVFMLCLASSTVLAGEGVKSIPDADEASLYGALHQIRYIKEGSPEVTTSKCIGNPITPLCAAETQWAIGLYDESDLSGIVFGKTPGVTELKATEPYDPMVRCYQLVGYWYFHNDDRTVDEVEPIQAGDVALQFWKGAMIDGECDLSFYGSTAFQGVIVRRGQFGWYSVNSHHSINYVQRPEWYTYK